MFMMEITGEEEEKGWAAKNSMFLLPQMEKKEVEIAFNCLTRLKRYDSWLEWSFVRKGEKSDFSWKIRTVLDKN